MKRCRGPGPWRGACPLLRRNKAVLNMRGRRPGLAGKARCTRAARRGGGWRGMEKVIQHTSRLLKYMSVVLGSYFSRIGIYVTRTFQFGKHATYETFE